MQRTSWRHGERPLGVLRRAAVGRCCTVLGLHAVLQPGQVGWRLQPCVLKQGRQLGLA